MKTLLTIALLCLSFQNLLPTTERHVEVIKVDGTINPATMTYIHEGIKRAEETKAECLIIQLNTPGGLLKSTRQIVSDLLQARVPVVVYVYPAGAQAASAGVFITLAANIAAMAPGTNIGAAHPVMMTEGSPNKKDSLDIMMEKATNDAAAFIRSIAEKRNRNIQWAENAVRKSVSQSETEALKEGIIDFVAPDMDSLIQALDGKEAATASGSRVLHTDKASIRMTEMSIIQNLLNIISDPNIAYILFMIGIYGLIFELYNPGSILPGIVGVISIVLAFYSFHSLPVNYAGLSLIIFAIILFILEIKIVSHGLLAMGGVVSLLIGSLMLINTSSAMEIASLSLTVVITVTMLTAMFFLFAIGKGIAAQRRVPVTGSEGLIGEIGVVIKEITPEMPGQVMVHGEIWEAESPDVKLNREDNVIVTGIEELKLKVKKSLS